MAKNLAAIQSIRNLVVYDLRPTLQPLAAIIQCGTQSIARTRPTYAGSEDAAVTIRSSMPEKPRSTFASGGKRACIQLGAKALSSAFSAGYWCRAGNQVTAGRVGWCAVDARAGGRAGGRAERETGFSRCR